jgi:hypothetical protein
MIAKRNGKPVANVGRMKGSTDETMFSTLADMTMLLIITSSIDKETTVWQRY